MTTLNPPLPRAPAPRWSARIRGTRTASPHPQTPRGAQVFHCTILHFVSFEHAHCYAIRTNACLLFSSTASRLRDSSGYYLYTSRFETSCTHSVMCFEVKTIVMLEILKKKNHILLFFSSIFPPDFTRNLARVVRFVSRKTFFCANDFRLARLQHY